MDKVYLQKTELKPCTFYLPEKSLNKLKKMSSKLQIPLSIFLRSIAMRELRKYESEVKNVGKVWTE